MIDDYDDSRKQHEDEDDVSMTTMTLMTNDDGGTMTMTTMFFAACHENDALRCSFKGRMRLMGGGRISRAKGRINDQ